MVIFGWAYFIVSIWLTLYGANALLLVIFYLYRKFFRLSPVPRQPIASESLPEVTIQLPIYNEPQVVRRLIDAAARLDYPPQKMIIQVLDDSTDETTALASEQVGYWRSRGKNITLIRRSNRAEYKAGALRYGMSLTRSEFFAIFDADFLPSPDWLKKAVQPFFEPNGGSIGMVQTRWTHLNEQFSPITRAQALLLDGHFGMEQRVRNDEGFFFGFNGTAGVWRRACIESAGGWRGDTLSEDLDLSYRAQISGWKFRYLPDVTAPAELPSTMAAFKIQQARWAKGSIQSVRKLAPKLITAKVSLWKKLEGFVHITGYTVHPLMVLMVLLSLPIALGGNSVMKEIPMAWLGIGCISTPLMFAMAEWSLYPREAWWKRFAWLPFLMMLGVGVAFSNSRAVVAGILNIKSPFQRTPKLGSTEPGGKSNRRKLVADSSGIGWVTLAELLLAGYALLSALLYVENGNWLGSFYLFVYAFGFSWVALASLWDAYSPSILKYLTPRRLDTRPE